MEPGTNERLLLQPWEEMDLGKPETWTAQVRVEPGVYVAVPVEQVAQLVAAGKCCRATPDVARERHVSAG